MIDESSLPTTRDEVEAWLLARQDAIAAKTRAALRRIVVSAYKAWLGTLTADATKNSFQMPDKALQGDLSALDDIPGRWMTYVNEELVNDLGETYQAGSVTAWVGTMGAYFDEAGPWAAVANENAVSYMATATNRLSGVGIDTWALVKKKTTNALRDGMSTEKLKEQIEDITQFSEFRADTIARTETVGAFVNGDMAGAEALGDKGPVEKVWVAAIDHRTRPSHATAHNQVVPFAALFNVGGVQMSHPHAAGAPAGEVVNCRCYVEFLYVGDARPDGTLAAPRAEKVPGPVAAPPTPPPAKPKRARAKPKAKPLDTADEVWGTKYYGGKPQHTVHHEIFTERMSRRVTLPAPRTIDRYERLYDNALVTMDRVVAIRHGEHALVFPVDKGTWKYLADHADDDYDDLIRYMKGRKGFAADPSDLLPRNVWALDEQLTELDDTLGAATRHLRQVVVSPYQNPQDAMWAEKYGNSSFFSAATGGNGAITYYGGQPQTLKTMFHEFGHVLDSRVMNLKLGESKQWLAATKADADLGRPTVTNTLPRFGNTQLVFSNDKGITKYGQTNRREDVAESFMLWANDKYGAQHGYPGASFAQFFPHRAAVLDELLAAAEPLPVSSLLT